MRRFLVRGAAFGLIQVVVAAVVLWQGSPSKSNHYYGAFQDKITRLQTCPGNRLIVLGGSNVAFGIDSEHLHQATGMETVNVGLHASLGLLHCLECVRQHGRSGDVVILVPEYELLVSDLQQGDAHSIRHLYEQWPQSSRYFDPARSTDWKQFFDRDLLWTSHEWVARAYTAVRKGRRNTGVYQRSSFNEYGDVVAHHGRTADTFKTNPPLEKIDTERLNSSIVLINEFARQCRERKIAVYLSYSPLPQATFRDSASAIGQIHDALSARLEVPVLDRPEAFVFPLDQFFDTEYHLTKSGGEKRTETLALALQKARAAETTILQADNSTVGTWR